jgi:hypothetical protein
MEIIVEIGNNDQKEIISKELSLIEKFSTLFNPSSPIIKIIVPENFDKAVNEIENTTDYTSVRGQIAVAKNIPTKEGVYLIFSRELYTTLHDSYTRFQMYFHELAHCFNNKRFPSLLPNPKADFEYLTNLYILFDEYYANRRSFELMETFFPQTSHRYKLHKRVHLKRFIDSITKNSDYYANICNEIFNYKFHGNVRKFLKNISPIFDEVSKAIIYTYAILDLSHKLLRLEPLLAKSEFVNQNTKDLIVFFRSKYNSGSSDLFDGIDIIRRFMTNFGIELEDTTEGLYYHVFDI